MNRRLSLIIVALLAIGLGIGLSMWRLKPKAVELPAQWAAGRAFECSRRPDCCEFLGHVVSSLRRGNARTFANS